LVTGRFGIGGENKRDLVEKRRSKLRFVEMIDDTRNYTSGYKLKANLIDEKVASFMVAQNSLNIEV